MEIRIISREIIKPSSPTPNHLRSHKLSPMDLFVRESYFSFVLYYSGACKNAINNSSDHLKKSLSKTLTYYYPFAGRVKDGVSVDCDDYGATFVEAKVAGDMSELLKQPEMELLGQLRPYNPEEMLRAQVNLAVQANYFDCGGVAISFYFRHVIADGPAAANFIKNWGKVACGADDIKDVVFDFTSSSFPPQISSFKITPQAIDNLSKEPVSKRFVFDGSKIAALREKIGNQATRFEAVTALIWGAMMASSKEERDHESNNRTQFAIIFAINLRKKMNPPLPEQCMGSVCTLGMTYWPTQETFNYNKLAGKVHGLIGIVDDYVRKGFENGWLNLIMDYSGIDPKSSETRTISVSSFLRHPFYEADFGWGKPIWVSISSELLKDTFNLLDISDGKGVEAWVGLSKEHMAKFEQDPGILAYASSIPTVYKSL
ncbi:hypothetical protein ACOSQ3_005259 [Xanthoceras sorbifolium]